MPKQAATPGGKLTVSLVGAGRLGTALALALASRGYEIQAVVARRVAAARKAARLFDKQPMALSEKQLDRLPQSGLILIATPDDIISTTARSLAATLRHAPSGRTALHTSGALSSKVLSPLAEAGFHVGSIHPLVSVSDPESGAAGLREAFYCLEGDRAALRVARSVVRDLGGRSFSIHARNKALYHAAAVMASGHIVALIDIAMEMLARCGLDRRDAQRVLLPLIKSTVNNLSISDPAHALTGTFARGDLATVKRQLAALNAEDLGEALGAYKLLGYRSLQLARKSGAPQALLKKIADTLED
jgi:predicted short-subunit dehydrogenase-like oxidoreductase (DUF2520 family)